MLMDSPTDRFKKFLDGVKAPQWRKDKAMDQFKLQQRDKYMRANLERMYKNIKEAQDLRDEKDKAASDARLKLIMEEHEAVMKRLRDESADLHHVFMEALEVEVQPAPVNQPSQPESGFSLFDLADDKAKSDQGINPMMNTGFVQQAQQAKQAEIQKAQESRHKFSHSKTL
ncbi:hypothetical protein ACMXYX_18065 (plasmid) [Neptuniibacter sp. QD72_48]|uniref:hypothetical protein n=1 Tax=Neptuniibacter sp. QD72_48 TaxID=3398214 RepID=UPI0039F59440